MTRIKVCGIILLFTACASCAFWSAEAVECITDCSYIEFEKFTDSPPCRSFGQPLARAICNGGGAGGSGSGTICETPAWHFTRTWTDCTCDDACTGCFASGLREGAYLGCGMVDWEWEQICYCPSDVT